MTNTLHTQLTLAKAASITPIQAGQLAADGHFEVRAAVAGNPRTTGAILRYLAEDDNRNVREAVLRNRATPFDVRETAVSSEDSAAVKLAYEKAPVAMQHELALTVARSTHSDLADLVARVRRAARQRAFDRMGAALGAEDAELIEAW